VDVGVGGDGLPHVEREAAGGELAHGVERYEGAGQQPDERSHEDEDPVALGLERAKGGAGPEHRAQHVDVHEAADLLDGLGPEPAGEQDGGGVHPDVDPPEVRHGPSRHVLGRLATGDIGRHDERLAALRLDHPFHVTQRRFAARHQHHAGAVGGERQCRRPPDPAGRAHDHHDRTAQVSRAGHDRRFPVGATPPRCPRPSTDTPRRAEPLAV
jgi:hypothetical protein